MEKVLIAIPSCSFNFPKYRFCSPASLREMRMAVIVFLVGILMVVGMDANATGKKREPRLQDPNSWTMVVIPDPQTYMKYEQNQPLFELITRWIKLNKEKLNIELVLCEGDLVEQNELDQPLPDRGDQTSTQQWEAVSRAFSVLDGEVPYILCTGNHDYGVQSAESRSTRFNESFAPGRNSLTDSLLVSMGENAFGTPSMENGVYEFVSPHGRPFLIFSLEFNPRKEAVDWAREIALDPKFESHTGILLTHSFLNSKNNRIIKETYPLEDVTHGEALWSSLISPAPLFEMVLCGHIADSKKHQGQTGYRKDANNSGVLVHQMLFNAQREGGGWQGNGGDGWIRLLEFLPDGKTVVVRTFSPLFFISPTTRRKAWRNRSFDSFKIQLSPFMKLSDK